MAILVLKQLVGIGHGNSSSSSSSSGASRRGRSSSGSSSGGVCLRDHHLATLEGAREEATLMLRNFYKVWELHLHSLSFTYPSCFFMYTFNSCSLSLIHRVRRYSWTCLRMSGRSYTVDHSMWNTCYRMHPSYFPRQALHSQASTSTSACPVERCVCFIYTVCINFFA